jgi:hypothetical protein
VEKKATLFLNSWLRPPWQFSHKVPRHSFGYHVHLFFIPIHAAQSPVIGELQCCSPSILTLPTDGCASSIQIEPGLAVPHQNSFDAQLNRSLPVAVQTVRSGVTAEQGSQGNPKLTP